MLNTLSRFIPEEERIITIEDTADGLLAAFNARCARLKAYLAMMEQA